MVTPENEFFWSSGADGTLRFRRCTTCGSLQHPPGPVCRTCGAGEFTVAATSGTGVVAGVTVNHHRWLPGLDPPYVIAIVALDDDPRVRLTTNLVGCDPDEVEVGTAVQVRFEQHEDVWLPMFTPRAQPAGAPLLHPVPEDEPVAPFVRPMASPDKFEDKVAITGIGMSRVGRRLGVPPLGLTVDACRAAVADAGLTMADIDGLATYPGTPPMGGHSEGGVTRAGGGAAVAAHLVQRGRGHARTERVGGGGHAGGGRRALPPRPVLPHRVGVDLGRVAQGAAARAPAGAVAGWRATSCSGGRRSGP